MAKPLLPPDFISIKPDIIFDAAIPDAPFRTWLKLRTMAWGCSETPELSLEQLKATTGLSRASLYGHMRLLHTLGRLRWRPGNTATLIFSFNECDDSQSNILDKPINTHVVLNDMNINNSSQSNILDKSKKLDKRTRTRKEKPSCPIEWMTGLFKLCGLPDNPSVGMRARVSKCGIAIIGGGAQPHQLSEFGEWWYRMDWRGQKGQPPTPEQVQDNWGKQYERNGHAKPITSKNAGPVDGGDNEREQAISAAINRRIAERTASTV